MQTEDLKRFGIYPSEFCTCCRVRKQVHLTLNILGSNVPGDVISIGVSGVLNKVFIASNLGNQVREHGASSYFFSERQCYSTMTKKSAAHKNGFVMSSTT
jgi:hypothetical protein